MTSSVSGARVMAGLSWRCVLYYVVAVAAAGGVVLGCAASGYAGIWPSPGRLLAAAAAVATVQLARLPLRVGGDTMMLAWGEAGAITALCLVPAGWVPLAGLAGAAVAHAHRMLGADHAVRVRISYTIGVLTLGGCTAAAVMAFAGSLGQAALDTPASVDLQQPATVGWLCLAGAGYFATTSLLTSAWVARTNRASLGQIWLRAARGKRLMLAASLVGGVGFGALVGVDVGLLVVLPPLAWVLHQVYGHQLQVAEDRRTWGVFADATKDLNQLDERAVVVAALRGAARLFQPDAVELVVFRPSGRRRRHVARTAEISAAAPDPRRISEFEEPTEARDGSDGTEETGADGGHRAVRRLFLAGVNVGELGLRFRRGARLAARDEDAFSAFAEAVSAALHDAATHRQLQAMTARSAYAAVHDTLTGLSNRSTLLARGTAELQRLTSDSPAALVLFDVDGLREVNDALGYAAGDEVLRVLAHRLIEAQGHDELLGRLGGDEYALLLTGARAGDAAYPMERARALAAALALPAEISGVTIAVEASAGVAVGLAGECGMIELLRRADVALHQAKRSGGRVARYTPSTGVTLDRLALLPELRDALATTDQIVLALQPAIDLTTGAPTGVEALVRWHHPRRGLLEPAEFIAVMEHSDLVDGFTRYVIDQALRIAAGWATQGIHLPISVNLSARSLLDRDLPGAVADRLAAHHVRPQRLILEITETAMVSDLAVIDEVVAGLRAIGVQVSVDDFGTGFSSLKFLTRVPVDEVKIDRAFVAHIGDSAEAAAIVRTTVDLAHELGLRVVAEGVETPAQRTALAALGATSAQGHLFYPAMAVEQATAVLQSLTQSATARAIPIVRAPGR